LLTPRFPDSVFSFRPSRWWS